MKDSIRATGCKLDFDGIAANTIDLNCSEIIGDALFRVETYTCKFIDATGTGTMLLKLCQGINHVYSIVPFDAEVMVIVLPNVID